MSRILFEDERPAITVDPGRADVALFVGLVRHTGSATPASVQDCMQAQGWAKGPYARPLDSLLDVPVPCETWAGFTSVFDAGGSAASNGTDYLAAAVRSFFAQGGKRCYVVRMGDPLVATESTADRKTKLEAILPDNTYRPDDPRSWHGAGHIGGLSDVSFLVTPDLPCLTASAPTGVVGEIPFVATGPEQFVECTPVLSAPQQFRVFQSAAPRLSDTDYTAWATAVRVVLQSLSDNFREVQFVAAFPLPQDDGAAASALAQDVLATIKSVMTETTLAAGSISSAFLQLGYPWLKTSGSHVLVESLEPPDGALVGVLARNALARGTFRSATKVAPSEIYEIWPELPMEETRTVAGELVWGDNSRKPLVERLSLFGYTPAGIRLLSDVTAYAGESYRPGRINRLVSVISRAARHLGEDAVFESNGETLWARVQTYLRQLMTRLWTMEALEGANVQQAFSVTCDRTTTTQNDLDNGRVVAVVNFTAAATIETLRITLAFEAVGLASGLTAQVGVI